MHSYSIKFYYNFNKYLLISSNGTMEIEEAHRDTGPYLAHRDTGPCLAHRDTGPCLGGIGELLKKKGTFSFRLSVRLLCKRNIPHWPTFPTSQHCAYRIGSVQSVMAFHQVIGNTSARRSENDIREVRPLEYFLTCIHLTYLVAFSS